MVHLPKIHNSVRPPIRVPYICDNYRPYLNSKLEFEHFGYSNDRLKEGDLGQQSIDQAASFLQAWLFFRLLVEISDICGVALVLEDFVRRAPDGSSVITTEQLTRYILYWLAAENDLLNDVLIEHIKRANACLSLAQEIVKNLSSSLFEAGTSYCIHSPSAAIHLSLAVIGDTLSYARSRIFHAGEGYLFAPIKWAVPPLGQELLLKAGWCLGEFANLYQQCNATVLYYLSGLDTGRLEKDHSHCGKEVGWLANQLNETYLTRHTESCAGCKDVSPPMQRISAILHENGIPLISASNTAGSDETHIEISEFAPGALPDVPLCVAISHVWSDGLENPRQNTLPTCQIVRIQKLVQALYRPAA